MIAVMVGLVPGFGCIAQPSTSKLGQSASLRSVLRCGAQRRGRSKQEEVASREGSEEGGRSR
jgi:hypothetical protein